MLNTIDSVWEPTSNTTKGGYQTLGNLFDNKDSQILKLQKNKMRKTIFIMI